MGKFIQHNTRWDAPLICIILHQKRGVRVFHRGIHKKVFPIHQGSPHKAKHFKASLIQRAGIGNHILILAVMGNHFLLVTEFFNGANPIPQASGFFKL